ncbi:hypothetical protein [Actinomycetospora chiangmaiensis]|uniref:hypothetical protein n=1 Tax=Actinomycetospora chiangmaiensis TaxID=402650 RepID=UPI0012F95113|nr:hypothetical protein [Actinomycetospora chiangmaiensis]
MGPITRATSSRPCAPLGERQPNGGVNSSGAGIGEPPRHRPGEDQRLLEYEVPSELHTYNGRGHTFDVAPALCRLCAAVTESFLVRNVVDPAADAADAAQYAFPPRRRGRHAGES